MKWMIPIGTFSGTRFTAHWSWGVLGLLILLGATNAQDMAGRALGLLGLTLSLVIHEWIHIAVGQHYKVKLKAIILMPLGRSLAEDLSQQELTPKAEVRIAAAGPLISIALGSGFMIAAESFALPPVVMWLGGANTAIGLLNLLPAFPLDGGYMLRGLLRFRWSELTATRWTNYVGKAIGYLSILVGFATTGLWWVGFLGVFIILSSRTEELSAHFRSTVRGRTAADVMTQTLSILPAAVRVADAYEVAKATTQSLFPVCFGTKPLGLVTRMELEGLVNSGRGEIGLSALMNRNILLGTGDEPLDQLLRRMANDRVARAVIMSEGEPIGVVKLDQVLQSQ